MCCEALEWTGPEDTSGRREAIQWLRLRFKIRWFSLWGKNVVTNIEVMDSVYEGMCCSAVIWDVLLFGHFEQRITIANYM